MHAGAVPVTLDWLAMQLDVHLILLAKSHHQIASSPQIIGGFGSCVSEDLEFPLALGNFGVDAFMIDTCRQAKFQVLLNDLTGHAAHVFVANTAVVGKLGNGWEAVLRKAERPAVFVEEILLFKTNPQVRIIFDGGAVIGGMWRAIRMHDFAKNYISVLAA